MESKFTAYLLHKFLEQTDTNLVFPVSIRMRPSKKAYKTSIFETNLVNSYRIMFDFSCLLSGRSRVRIPTSVPENPEKHWAFRGSFCLFWMIIYHTFWSKNLRHPLFQRLKAALFYAKIAPLKADFTHFHTFSLQLYDSAAPFSDWMNSSSREHRRK